MSRISVLCLFGLSLTGMLSARTVALWPIERTASGAFDGRCVIDSVNDLQMNNGTVVDADIGWTLPPNPDTAPKVWQPLNQAAAQNVSASVDTKSSFLYSPMAGDYVRRDVAFTAEGFLKIVDLPPHDKWAIVMAGFDDNAVSSHRWTLSLRCRPNENYACSWILWANGGSGDTVLHAYESEEASAAITNTWMHVALTHQPVANGKEVWSLYLNGTKVGETTQSSRADDAGGHRFSLGGRGNGNQLLADFDYWRLSDTCLTPDQFLNAGNASGTTLSNDTVAYWPLDVTPNGGVDGRDAVGDSPLTSGNGFNNMLLRTTRLGASEACAFAGNPPNPTVTLPKGNAGSLRGAATSSNLQIDGAMLNLSQDFTVEGWFAPRICDRPTKGPTEQSVCYLFGTRSDYSRGWNLEYRAYGEGNVSFVIYCVDQIESGQLVNNASVSGDFDMANWYETWHHVALTYDVDGGANGFGRWTLFIDGVQTGFHDNSRAVNPITDTRRFCLGGRGEVAERSFLGQMDCLRICTAALTPEQLMCTPNGTAASNVYGLWPLNVSGGVALDLEDVSGNGRHFANLDSQVSKQQVTAMPGDAPVITNPDPTPTFRGDRTHLKGSTGFRKLGGSNQHRSCLVSGTSLVLDALRGRQNFTLECYYKRDATPTQGDECLFVGCNDTSARIRIFRRSAGLYVWEAMSSSPDLKDTLIPGTSDSDLVAGTWYHLAIVHSMERIDSVERSVWRVYVNGELKGNASQTAKTSVDSAIMTLAIGGRWFSDNNSVNGNLSSVRLSRVALDPSDFLCAAPKLPAEKTVTAYWPIDASGTGLGSLVETTAPFTAEGTAVAQDEKARASIPNYSTLTNEVIGNARRNAGSYAFGEAGALKAEGVGTLLSLARPFTVEGWLKWTPSDGTSDEDLVVAGNLDGHGVRIFIDKSGTTPRLRVKARGLWPCTPWIDTAFAADLTPFAHQWTHFAVVYDPGDFMGSWTLLAEGRPLGEKIYNFYHPSSTDAFRSGDFRLGSTVHPLVGSVDMWRLTSGTLAAEDLLYAAPRGMVIYIR